MNNLLTVDDLKPHDIRALILRALDFKQNKDFPNYPHTIVNIFYENSTRTKYSFKMAEKHLGMDVIDFEIESSSINKGESLYDTLLTFKALGAELAVVRHPDNNFYDDLQTLDMGIINAGAGSGAHPTQSLLDMMTIYEEFETFQNLKVAIVGDLKHSRVAKSNMKLLKTLGAQLYFCSPKEYQDKDFENYGEYKSIDEVVEFADVVMLLRIQKERHKTEHTDEHYCDLYGMNPSRYERLKNDAIIMHPGPINRNVEISEELIEAPKSRFVMQMTNGVYMRMAILEKVSEEARAMNDIKKCNDTPREWNLSKTRHKHPKPENHIDTNFNHRH